MVDELLPRCTPDALEAVFRERYQRLYTLTFRLAGSRQDAEDALQTAFANALAALGHFREQATIETWVYRIVTNCAISLRKQARRLPVAVYAERMT